MPFILSMINLRQQQTKHKGELAIGMGDLFLVILIIFARLLRKISNNTKNTL
jgi:hypothetical protein